MKKFDGELIYMDCRSKHCEKFIKENKLEYIRGEVELYFRRGFFTACRFIGNDYDGNTKEKTEI